MSDQITGAAYRHEVNAYQNIIEKVCGARPVTCPWNVFKNPIVRDVMAYRAAVKARTLASKRSVPRRVLAAATFYESALNAARFDRMERERKKRERDRPKQKE